MERRDERSRTTWTPEPRASRPVRVIDGGRAPAASAPQRDRVHRPERGESTPVSKPGPEKTIGRYALHAEIASGGMAAVHIGRLLGPVGFARTVAIKRLHPPLAKDPEFVAMFLDEARLAARIRHPNVVSTLDVVATEGELFVVMEYVAGESLARLLRVVRTANEAVPIPIAAAILVGVLHGLHAAHEAHDERGEPLRIVHRDVSPHNILVGTDGAAHVIDFGIAKARGRMQVTRQGQIKGKLSYMPAEQLLGQGLDRRADLFAASIVFWESLTGQRLFHGTDDADVYAKVLLGRVDPPSLYVEGLPESLDAIVLRGLARDRTQRYSSARDMALAIEAAIPLAPPSQVGSWVERLVGDALAERAEQIASIERGDESDPDAMSSSALISIRSGPSALPARSQDQSAPTQRSRIVGSSSSLTVDPQATQPDRPSIAPPPGDSLAAVAGVQRRTSRRTVVVVALLLFAVVAFASVRFRDLRDAAARPATPPRFGVAPDSAAAHPSSATSPEFRPAYPSQDWTPVVTPAPEPAAPSASVGRKVAPTTQPPASAQAHSPAAGATNVGAPAVTAALPPTGKNAGCNPPFWIDADGTKRYYRHCANL